MIAVYKSAAYDLSKAIGFGLDKDEGRKFHIVYEHGDSVVLVEYEDKKFAWDEWIKMLGAYAADARIYIFQEERCDL